MDTRYSDPVEIPVGDGTNAIRSLKARAVIVDMEEGVINNMVRGPLGELFDDRQFISDVSGAGNNWYVGDRRSRIKILDTMRTTRSKQLYKRI